jgi:hypothetical protein
LPQARRISSASIFALSFEFSRHFSCWNSSPAMPNFAVKDSLSAGFQPDPESIDQDTPRSCAMHFSELVFQILYAAEIFAEQQICRPLSKNNIAAIGRE